MLCPFGLADKRYAWWKWSDCWSSKKSSFSFFSCHDEVQKMKSNKMTKYNIFTHSQWCAYIHNQKKCSTSEYFTTKLW